MSRSCDSESNMSVNELLTGSLSVVTGRGSFLKRFDAELPTNVCMTRMVSVSTLGMEFLEPLCSSLSMTLHHHRAIALQLKDVIEQPGKRASHVLHLDYQLV